MYFVHLVSVLASEMTTFLYAFTLALNSSAWYNAIASAAFAFGFVFLNRYFYAWDSMLDVPLCKPIKLGSLKRRRDSHLDLWVQMREP